MPYSYTPHYHEDFEAGETFETIGRTVTETDIVNQAANSADWSEYHTNEAYASENLFGERIAQAPLTFSISMGLMTMAGFLARTAAGLDGMDDTRFPNPVSIGDTLSATITVTDTENVDRDGVGIVELEMVILPAIITWRFSTPRGVEIFHEVIAGSITRTEDETVVFETSLTLFVRTRAETE
jgi:acyl dehydratase